MSIRDLLRHNLELELVEQIEPLFPGAAQERLVFATPEVAKQLDPNAANEELQESAGHLRGWIDNFIRGRSIVVGKRRSKNADMKLLEPERDEVWEIRKRDTPSARIFGRFIEKNVFMALGARSVDGLFAEVWENKLGLEVLPIWNQEIRNAKAKWRVLFPSFPPYSGSTISDYLSSAVDEGSL